VDAIGLEMYREILDNTIKKMRGEKIEEKFCDSDISLPSAILPEGYVQDTMERMKIYRRLANVKSVEEVEDIKKEIIDRFGKIPESSENLFVHSEIRVLICDLKIVKVSYQNGNVELVFRDKETLADFSKFKKFHSVNLQKNVMILSDVVKDGNLKALLKLLLEYKKHADQKEGVA
jgi:transcription-repair coupling factor (superfamily II helicase)